MRKYIKTAVLTVIAIISAACQRDFDLKYHEIEPLTVIEAELTPDGIRAGITRTTPMDEPMNRSLLTDAIVTLTDITDGVQYYLMADADGYFTDPTPGIEGHVYRLSVERNGEIFQAETTMYPPTEIIDIRFNWINMPYDQVAVLQGQFLDNPSVNGDCYWIKLYRNGEIYMWKELDDRSAVNGIGTFFTITTRRDTTEEDDDTVLFDGDIITMTIERISRSMHDYLEALQNDSNGPALFSGPRCLGYFSATSPSSASITFHPDDIPVFQ
ncbi:MAG: DUF4249 domain-containing protein [Muribaculaceae bacterium]|nr:DUF4249 domain-containing protein [Muribaculaceae bacterium]